MKKTFSGVLDRMIQLLREFGIPYAKIKRDPKVFQATAKTYQQSLRVQKDGQNLEVIIEASRMADVMNTGKHQRPTLPRFHHLAFEWTIIFSVVIRKNEHNLSLSLSKETTKNKLTKLLWKRDLEVFNSQFDEVFWIKSNNSYAHAMLLDESIQKQLLEQAALFGVLEVQGQRLYYRESLLRKKQLKEATIRKHYLSMLGVCLNLAKKIEEWSPPIDT